MLLQVPHGDREPGTRTVKEASFLVFCGWLADQAHSRYEGMPVLTKSKGSFPTGAVGGV
jgi:hypothetical protein